MPTDRPNENVDTVASLRARAAQGVSPHQKRIEHLTSLIGRPHTLYLIFVFALLWCLGNVLAPKLSLIHI